MNKSNHPNIFRFHLIQHLGGKDLTYLTRQSERLDQVGYNWFQNISAGLFIYLFIYIYI